MTAEPKTASPPAAAPVVSSGYRRFALTMLLFIGIANFIDRQIIGILAEPIKEELNLADWQIGALGGLAFALCYSLLSIPIARFAERSNRPLIISVSLAVWSAFTALSGFAQTYLHLVLARIGVGIGEAGSGPASQSLVSDYYPRETRASALAFLAMGPPIGAMVGLIAGGATADIYGWRVAFFIVGLPGLVLAVIALLTLVEPRVKQLAADLAPHAPKRASFSETLRLLRSRPTYLAVVLGASTMAFVSLGQAPFNASFLLRVHAAEIASLSAQTGLPPLTMIGIALGLMIGASGVIGVLMGGRLADKLGARDLRSYVMVPAIGALASIPLHLIAFAVDSAIVSVIFLGLTFIASSLWFGPVFATVQSIVPPHMRATASAVMGLATNLIALGLGPLTVGIMSDVFAGPMGMGSGEGVRWSLIVSSFFTLSTFFFFMRARKTVAQDMQDQEQQDRA